MGHLGEGTQIATVQDKGIVLTATNGQYFRMNITDLTEVIRKVMPIVTLDAKGLMPNNLLDNYSFFETINPGEEVNTKLKPFSGAILSVSEGSGRGAILFVDARSSFSKIIYSSFLDLSEIEESGKMSIYRKEFSGSIFIKNDTTKVCYIKLSVLNSESIKIK